MHFGSCEYQWAGSVPRSRLPPSGWENCADAGCAERHRSAVKAAKQESDRTVTMRPSSARHEGALDHVVARISHMRGLIESSRVQQLRQLSEHRRAAADHRAIDQRIERRNAEYFE